MLIRSGWVAQGDHLVNLDFARANNISKGGFENGKGLASGLLLEVDRNTVCNTFDDGYRSNGAAD